MDAYIPPRFRCVFHFDELNGVQSALCREIFTSKSSLIVSAPTGCGKTVIFELNLIKYLTECEALEQEESSCVVYIAPLKALCNEKYQQWKTRFKETKLKCILSTGDNDPLQLDQLTFSTVLVTTPEKLDSFIKSGEEGMQLLRRIKYCFVDEIHLLGETDRGPLLEVLITRIKMISDPRFVCVSATMSNSEDLATWLSNQKLTAVFYHFGDEFRPSKIKKLVIGYYKPKDQPFFQFDTVLSHKLIDVIRDYSENKPVLVFCTTRRGTVQVAREVTKHNLFQLDHSLLALRQQYTILIKDTTLKGFVALGVGYHHAGLDVDDRRAVEKMFLAGCLPVLGGFADCLLTTNPAACTSTLALGLNLPAHLVIVKNTEQLINGELRGYSSTQIAQMIGRAGRPQFDAEGVAVVMTSHELKKLLEYLNAEICLNMINNIEESIKWYSQTFLYVRIRRAPQFYGLCSSINSFQNAMENACWTAIRELHKLGLVTLDETTGDIRRTDFGVSVARNYVEVTTVRMMWELRGNETMEDLIHFVACCSELYDIPLRNNEKTTLNNLNRSRGKYALRFPLQGRILTVQMKIVCLLQAVLSNRVIEDFSLQQDAQRILRCARRIINALVSLLCSETETTSHRLPPTCSKSKCMMNALELKKTLHHGTWLNRPLVALLACPTLNRETIEQLVDLGLTSLSSIEKRSPDELEKKLGRAPPFGDQLQAYIRSIPKYALDVQKLELANDTEETIQLTVSVERECAPDTAIVLLGDGDNEILARFLFKSSELIEGRQLRKVRIPITKDCGTLHVCILSTNFAGIDIHTRFALDRVPSSSKLHENYNNVMDDAIFNTTPATFPQLSLGYADRKSEDIHTTSDAMRLKTPLWPEAHAESGETPSLEPLGHGVLSTSTPVSKPLRTSKRFTAPRKLFSSAKTSKLNVTYQWTPATAASTPPATPLIQTSMLDYMRVTKRNSGLTENTHTQATPSQLTTSSPGQDDTNRTPLSSFDKPKRFRWCPVVSSTVQLSHSRASPKMNHTVAIASVNAAPETEQRQSKEIDQLNHLELSDVLSMEVGDAVESLVEAWEETDLVHEPNQDSEENRETESEQEMTSAKIELDEPDRPFHDCTMFKTPIHRQPVTEGVTDEDHVTLTTRTPMMNSTLPIQDCRQDPSCDLVKPCTETPIFKMPSDIRFTKLLSKWRNYGRAVEEKAMGAVSGSIDVELINTGWEELACWIRTSQICQLYGIPNVVSTDANPEDTPKVIVGEQFRRCLSEGPPILTHCMQQETESPQRKHGNPVDLDEYAPNQDNCEE